MEQDFFNRFNTKKIADKQIDTLIGLSMGIVADGKVNQSEAETLRKWLVSCSASSASPMIQNLLIRVDEMLSDSVLDNEEASELLSLLNKLSGSDFDLGELQKATTLPLCDPEPKIIAKNKRFCFTGTFAFGNRKACEAAVIDRAGTVGGVSKSTNYLVIGTYVTDSWIHQSFGRKIEQAVEWRDQGNDIHIVSEITWIAQLGL